MANFNKVLLMGNMTRDPDIRVTPNNLTIAKFGLAVNRKYRTKEGEDREETTFVDIDAFGSQAEVIQKYCRRGTGIFVEGRLKLDQWQDKNSGDNRSKLGIILENFQFIGGRGESTGESSGNPYEANTPPSRKPENSSGPAASGGGEFEDDDEVPF